MALRALYDVPAPAKLNLFLHIVGRRADGYHLLQSAFVLVDWADTLHFELRSDGRLARHDLRAALPDDDLCLRAARALQSASACTQGADISIHKQVPWGAGMGGGSSDAASTLLALNRLWGLEWPRAQLQTLALQLGADVPFFVGGHNALVEGVGERLTPLPLPPAAYAVVKPAATLATRDIFEHPALKRDTDPVIVTGCLEEAVEDAARGKLPAGGLQEVGLQEVAHGWGTNDLQDAAQDRCAEVAQAASWLDARFGNSRMTGSGSAVFARLENSRTAGSPLATFAAEALPPGWVGRVCHSLQQHPLAGWAG